MQVVVVAVHEARWLGFWWTAITASARAFPLGGRHVQEIRDLCTARFSAANASPEPTLPVRQSCASDARNQRMTEDAHGRPWTERCGPEDPCSP